MKKQKSKTFIVTAEFDVDLNDLYDDRELDTVPEELVGHWVKVKSGLYNNALMGVITNVVEK